LTLHDWCEHFAVTATPGYSTDRAENYMIETQRSTTNTLTLTDRKKQPQPTYSSDDADQTRSSNVPMADFEDDVRHFHSLLHHLLMSAVD